MFYQMSSVQLIKVDLVQVGQIFENWNRGLVQKYMVVGGVISIVRALFSAFFCDVSAIVLDLLLTIIIAASFWCQ
jgi:hypothetical protein